MKLLTDGNYRKSLPDIIQRMLVQMYNLALYEIHLINHPVSIPVSHSP